MTSGVEDAAPRPLRIGIDIRSANPVEPGQQRYLWRLAGWLGARGHEVHLLTLRRQPDQLPPRAGVTLHRLHGRSRPELLRFVTQLELDTLLLNPERSRRYRGLPANLLRSAYGTEHYRQKLRSFRRPLERALRAALRANPLDVAERRWERAFYEAPGAEPDVIAQSRYMRAQIQASYRVPDEHVHVIPNAVDTEEYSVEARLAMREEMRARWSIPDAATCFLFLGHNFRLKGLWDLLDVFARRVRDPDAHLLVVGRGTGRRQRARARELVAHLGLDGRVTLAGAVHPSLHAHAAADALLHLSWHDSFGFVTLEAMACGLPVVTTPFAGASELMEDGISGLVVDPGTPEAVAAAIDRLADPEVRGSLGRAAARIGSSYDEPANFERVERVMRIAAERRGVPIGR